MNCSTAWKSSRSLQDSGFGKWPWFDHDLIPLAGEVEDDFRRKSGGVINRAVLRVLKISACGNLGFVIPRCFLQVNFGQIERLKELLISSEISKQKETQLQLLTSPGSDT